MKQLKSGFVQALMAVLLMSSSLQTQAHHFITGKGSIASKKAKIIAYITTHYPEQLTDPQKKMRKTFSQFGYGLSEFRVQLFPITKFVERDNYGAQSYGRPNRLKEKNGAIYTCRGGFIDFSHMRASIDWTVFLTFKILTEQKDFNLPDEAGTLSLRFNGLNKLTVDDIASMAQKIAFERLTWHEVASWHYHKPYRLFTEQQSTFTPEDNYSNFLGTVIGKNVALRLLSDTNELEYSEVATEEINKVITALIPVDKRQSRQAYDIVDRNKQKKLPEAKRNNDVWYDSRIVFRDQRYVFKRDLNIGPGIDPWLVPKAASIGCDCDKKPEILHVPQLTKAGKDLYDYYDFRISPDTALFYDQKRDKELHPAFAAFSTCDLGKVIDHIRLQMAAVLTPGFDRRDGKDPVVYFTDVRHVLFK